MWINVKSNTIANAMGDGINDDTDALEEIFNFVTQFGESSTFDERDVIYFPPGRYRISRTLQLRDGWGTRLVGSGNILGTDLYLAGHAIHAAGACLFWTGEPGEIMLEIAGTYHGTIENLAFVGGAPQEYKFDSSTSNGEPNPGFLRFNATLTELYIDLENAVGADATWLLDALDEGSAPRLTITNRAQAGLRVFDVTAVHTETGYRRVAVNLVQSQGSFALSNIVQLDFTETGGSPQRCEFSTTTTDSDPGTGKLRFNHGTFGSITQIFVDNQNLSGFTITSWLDTLAGPGLRITISKQSDSAVVRVFSVTGAVVDGSGYRKIPVTAVYSAGSLADTDPVIISLSRTDPIRNRAGALVAQKSTGGGGFPAGHALFQNCGFLDAVVGRPFLPARI